jgi:hypothetical protein
VSIESFRTELETEIDKILAAGHEFGTHTLALFLKKVLAGPQLVLTEAEKEAEAIKDDIEAEFSAPAPVAEPVVVAAPAPVLVAPVGGPSPAVDMIPSPPPVEITKEL